MILSDALGLGQEKVIAFVGGGGKTTAMYRLAAQLAEQGSSVIVTTTTKIYMPDPKDVGYTIITQDVKELCIKVKEGLHEYPTVAVGYDLLQEGKLKGVPPQWVEVLAELADYVMVEADGANGKPFKAPADHEPVIPDKTEIVIAVVGSETVGLALNKENVHRPECIRAITGLGMEEILTPDVIATVLLHPAGIFKGTLPGVRKQLIINKVDDEGRLAVAREIGLLALNGGGERVVIARLKKDLPVMELLL
ncbi:selenium cofactor biosynthesis protein YqeC [Desulfitobacterium hafniense]|uniref:Selenium-dependent hydroxylase accessory protein YqeC n=1 Tax=Desulfitobacterium hafniense (strain Y51) TaxID=138119 RepID=Q24Z86_DESHY|nr:selenium cofactor biosynthesis protein YqeC [Desulfitobacterium hafniense]BAE82656.1 hypothetical protein DSY0867 [Desulfitobacterium hafniense Y51]